MSGKFPVVLAGTCINFKDIVFYRVRPGIHDSSQSPCNARRNKHPMYNKRAFFNLSNQSPLVYILTGFDQWLEVPFFIDIEGRKFNAFFNIASAYLGNTDERPLNTIVNIGYQSRPQEHRKRTSV